MSKNEVTLKITCSMQEFKQILKDKGFKFIEDFLLDDTYFISNSINLKEMSIREILNNAVILRNVVGYTEKYQSIKLVKKHKEFDSNGNIIKQSKKECDIKDIEQGREFLKDLGYKELMRIKENGSIFLKDDFEIETKDIQNGDKLIEIEENDTYKTIDSIKEQLKEFNLPIDTNDYFIKKAEVELKKVL